MNKEKEIPKDLTLEQYRIYSDLLRQTNLQRAISSYFFIAMNLFIMISGYIIYPETVFHFTIFLIITIMGILICIYWLYESRESYIINEVRYRSIMKLEMKLFKKGVLNEEWERLGQYRFRRSPVFFTSLGRYIPVFFAIGHSINLFILFILRYSYYI